MGGGARTLSSFFPTSLEDAAPYPVFEPDRSPDKYYQNDRRKYHRSRSN